MEVRRNVIDAIAPWQCRAARAALGWKVAELASIAGLSKGAVVTFETGVRTPRAATLEALTAAFSAQGLRFAFRDGVAIGILFEERPASSRDPACS